jgi:hypothetical protein
LSVTDGEAHGLGEAFEPLVVVTGVVAVCNALLGVDPVHRGVEHRGQELLTGEAEIRRQDPHHRRAQLFEPAAAELEAIDADLEMAGADRYLLEQLS